MVELTRAGQADPHVGREVARLDAEECGVRGRVARGLKLERPGPHLHHVRRPAIAAAAADIDLDVQRPGVDVGEVPVVRQPAIRHLLGVTHDAVGRAAVDGARALDHAAGGPALCVVPDLHGVRAVVEVRGEAAAGQREPLVPERAPVAKGHLRDGRRHRLRPRLLLPRRYSCHSQQRRRRKLAGNARSGASARHRGRAVGCGQPGCGGWGVWGSSRPSRAVWMLL